MIFHILQRILLCELFYDLCLFEGEEQIKRKSKDKKKEEKRWGMRFGIWKKEKKKVTSF